MRTKHYARHLALIGTILCLFLATAVAQKKSYTFKGKVEKVDAAAKKITVNGEKVEGWMDSMTMLYSVDKEDMLKTLKVGDQITAKVFEGDYTVLHEVKVVPAPAKK